MKKRFLCIMLVLLMALWLLPAGASAAEGGKALRRGTDGISGYDESGYSYIYYGTWNGSPIKWRVLDDKTNMGTNGLFLLSEELLGSGNTGGIKFGYDDEDTWQGSKVQAWCRDFAGIEGDSVPDAFTAAELAAILETSKSDPEYFTPTEKVVIDGREWTLTGAHFLAVENALNGDKVFFLSAAEAKNAVYGLAEVEARAGKYNGKEACWWLRSPAVDRFAGYVDYLGYVYPTLRNDPYAARPAFNLDAGAVLFVSPAVGGKPDGFGAVGQYAGNEWKLTVEDGARSDFAVKRKSGSWGSVTFDYKNAKTGNNEYISAMVTNGGEAKYYGRLKNITAEGMESGTLTLTLPSGYDEGKGDRLYIFNEQCNGDRKTDYSSRLIGLAEADAGENRVQIRINSDTGEWEVSYDGGETWTSLGVKAEGDKGDRGEKGEAGEKGEKGDKGENGEKGDKGDKGEAGEKGEKGDKGEAGADGRDGIAPRLKIETDGYWYVSYDGGQTWTALGVKAVGDKGDKGDPGENGQDGIAPQLKVGKDNYWYVSYDGGKTWVSLGVKAVGDKGEAGEKGEKGDKGEKGQQGDAGRQGTDGLIPCIGENGNWWLGDTDTGVKAMTEKTASAGEAPAKDGSTAVAAAAAAIAGAALIGNIVLLAVVLKRRKKRL